MKSVVLALFALGFFGSAICASSNNYTYLVLVSEWPGSVCHLNHCNETQGLNETFFNLHGLWPTNPSGNGPSYCTNATFNQSLLNSATQNELLEYWSGLYSSSSEFHAHEWQKHGTCWVPQSSVNNLEQAFFTEVISQALKADIYGTLAAAGITPRYESYSYDDFVKPLEAKFQKVQLQCQDNFIIGINICMNLNYEYEDCPDTSAENFLGLKSSLDCGDDINYPAFSSDLIADISV